MKQKTIFTFAIVASASLFSSCANPFSKAATPTPETPVATEESQTQDTSKGYPVAKPMVDPSTGQAVKDHYISPFKPYNPIVAKGFKSGQKAGDPSTIKTDSKGNQDKSTMKVFVLP